MSDAEYNDLCLLVHSYNARLTDTSPMWSLPNQQLIRSHGVAKQQRRDAETLEQTMKKAEEKMSSVWDAKASKYISWRAAGCTQLAFFLSALALHCDLTIAAH